MSAQSAPRGSPPGAETREVLFKAYVAGFLASGEGFNGEYPYDDGEQDPSNDLRDGFLAWLARHGFDGQEVRPT